MMTIFELIPALSAVPASLAAFEALQNNATQLVMTAEQAQHLIKILMFHIQHCDESSLYSVKALDTVLRKVPNMSQWLATFSAFLFYNAKWSFLVFHKDEVVQHVAMDVIHFLAVDMGKEINSFVPEAQVAAYAMQHFQPILATQANIPHAMQQTVLADDMTCSLPKLKWAPQASNTNANSMFAPHEHILAWVDDHPENNKQELDAARNAGIKVFTFVTTFAVKAWLLDHEELRSFGANNFRIITDRHRDEKSIKNDITSDSKAGAAFKDWLRAKGWPTPIMIYCGYAEPVKHAHEPANYCWVSTVRTNCVHFACMQDLNTIK